jgi:hypothetical protein
MIMSAAYQKRITNHVVLAHEQMELLVEEYVAVERIAGGYPPLNVTQSRYMTRLLSL